MLGRDVTPENANPVDFYSDSCTQHTLNYIHRSIRDRLNKGLQPQDHFYVHISSFGLQHLGCTTVCILRIRGIYEREIIGISRCSPNDEYSPVIGLKLAISRAIRKAYELKADSL